MTKSGPIIIVEDDMDDQYLYKHTLQKCNVKNEIIFFDNGKDALNYLKTPTVTPFLILSDINMPLMNGLELRELIFNDELLRMKSIPFVFISTSARETEIDKGYKLSVQGFFKKEAAFDRQENLLLLIIEYWKNCRQPKTSVPSTAHK